ncbi:MAG: hypothetical protein EOM29_04235 [Bacteroidia bacterium]|nr:hypothetical protein [Bacteroidia bacterium]
MEILNSEEKQYLISIIKTQKDLQKNYNNFINEFNNEFIARFIYNTLFDIDYFESDIELLIDQLYNNDDGGKLLIDDNIIKEFFFDPFNKRIGRNSTLNIIEIINNFICSKKTNKSVFLFLCLRKILNELIKPELSLFSLDNKKYIQIIEYEIYRRNNIDFSYLKKFGEYLLVDLINIYIFTDKQMILCTEYEKNRFEKIKRKAIGIYNIYMSDETVDEYIMKSPFTQNIFIDEVYVEISRMWILKNYVPDNQIREDTSTNHDEKYNKIEKLLAPHVERCTPNNIYALIENKTLNDTYVLVKKNSKKECILFAKIFNIPQDTAFNIIRYKKDKQHLQFSCENIYFKNTEINLVKNQQTPFEEALINIRNDYLNKINPKEYPILEVKS